MTSPAPRPLLSASLIVKDEEVMLPRCLEALEGVVDEVIVYDTGSSDRTVEIAEAAGVIVHRGEWHDDFARARNDALSHCSGRWVIYVDADEELRVGDVAAFRKALARTDADAFTVRIENVEDHGGSITFTHEPIRLFRRVPFTFEGAIHEHVVARSGRRVVVRPGTDLSILHQGYRPDVVASKNKVQRNAELAEAAWRAAPDDVKARLELARSLSSTGRHEETLQHLNVLRAHGGEIARTALQLGVKVLLQAGDLEEALRWAVEVDESYGHSVQSAYHHADVLFRLGRFEDSLAALDGAPELGEDAGVHGTHDTGMTGLLLRARLLRVLGDEASAADVLVSIADRAPVTVWSQLVDLLHRRDELDRSLTPFFRGVELAGTDRARGVLAELSKGPLELGEAFCAVLATRADGLRYALAFVHANAGRLSTDRAAAWSSVARAAELTDVCPLIAQSTAVLLPAMQRLLAAATAAGTFRDERGRSAIRQVAALLEDEEIVEALYVLSELAPEALVDLVEGYATSQRRALVMARAMVSLGAEAEAALVLQHGLQECPPDPFSEDAIVEALADMDAVV